MIRIRTVPDHTVMERYGRVEGEPPVPAAPEDRDEEEEEAHQDGDTHLTGS